MYAEFDLSKILLNLLDCCCKIDRNFGRTYNICKSLCFWRGGGICMLLELRAGVYTNELRRATVVDRNRMLVVFLCLESIFEVSQIRCNLSHRQPFPSS